MTMIAHAPKGLGPKGVNRLLRLFNAGYGVDRIAAVLEVSAEEVQAHLAANPDRRGRAEGEAPRPVTYLIPREDLPFEIDPRVGSGGPTFANHAGHVARVMAAGGFVTLTEYEEEEGVRTGLPLRRPIYAEAEA